MTLKRDFKPKTSLTPIDKIRVAYLYECEGVAMQTLAVIFQVNAGRIAEAIKTVRGAVGLTNDLEEEEQGTE